MQSRFPVQHQVDAEAQSRPPTPVSTSKQYLGGFWLIPFIFAQLLVSTMAMLYALVLPTAIPSITAEFNTISDLDWYSTAYLLATCAIQPLTGRLYTLFPVKAVYLFFIGVFAAGNLIAALAPRSGSFIVGRAVAGMGSAGLTTGAMVFFTVAIDPKLRATMIGVGLACTSIGGVVGPVIGGSLTQYLGWRWCLWIFMPPAALTAIIITSVPVPKQNLSLSPRAVLRGLPQKLDILGFALFAPAVAMFNLSMSWGGQKASWNSSVIIGLLCGAVATSVAFVAWQSFRKDQALIPPSIFKKHTVFYGCLVSFLQGGAFIMMGFYLPLWFQSVKQATPTSSGVMLLPTMVSQIIASSVSGLLIAKVGYVSPIAVAGNLFSAIGAGLMTRFVPSTPEGQWIGYQIPVGVGRGFVLQMPIVAIQALLPDDEIAIGVSTTIFSQFFGGTVFLAIAKSIFVNGLQHALQKYAPSVDPEQIINAGATEILKDMPPEEIEAVIRAYNQAIAPTFWLASAAGIAAFFCSFGLGWTRVGNRKQTSEESSRRPTGVNHCTKRGISTHKAEEQPTRVRETPTSSAARAVKT